MKGWLFTTLVLAALPAACARATPVPYATPLTGKWFGGVNQNGGEYLTLMPEVEYDPLGNIPMLNLYCNPRADRPPLQIYIGGMYLDWHIPCRLWYENGEPVDCRVYDLLGFGGMASIPEYTAYDDNGHGVGETTVNQMMSHRQMYFEFTRKSDSQVLSYTYDLSGLDHAFAPMRASCQLP